MVPLCRRGEGWFRCLSPLPRRPPNLGRLTVDNARRVAIFPALYPVV